MCDEMSNAQQCIVCSALFFRTTVSCIDFSFKKTKNKEMHAVARRDMRLETNATYINIPQLQRVA